MPWFVAENTILTAASGLEGLGFVILTGIFLAGLASKHLQGGIRSLTTIKLGSIKSRISQMEKALEAIEEADPDFDLEDFCAAAASAFITVEKAIDEGELDQIHPISALDAFKKSVGRACKVQKEFVSASGSDP